MTHEEMQSALKRLSVETGSLACLGCEYEHNCGTQGCAVIREAMELLEDRETLRGAICVFCKENARLNGMLTGCASCRYGGAAE